MTIERGEEHDALWGHLGIDRPDGWWHGISYELDDLYPDAVACLEAVRALGLRVGIVGNQTEALERWARESALPADVISSSASLGVRKPDPRFFEQIVELAGLRGRARSATSATASTTTSSRLLAAGLVAVHVRRGPWGRLQERARRRRSTIDSLAELPEALASLA